MSNQEKKEKRKSYRDRYFEDYKKVKVPAKNKKGFRTDYQYVGLWKSWETGDDRPLWPIKKRMLYMEAGSIFLFVLPLLSGTALTTSRIAGGFGILSIAAWLVEITAFVRFLFKGVYIKELSWDEIDKCFRIGCLWRAILVALSVLAGLIDVLIRGAVSVADVPVALALLASATLSLLVRKTYCGLYVSTYRNEDGKPGTRI